jgi:Winged helix DNA-binding domain
MPRTSLIPARIAAQGLSGEVRNAADAVRHLGAVQAQEFRFATWSLALRAGEHERAGVHTAFDAGQILRTHALRPTWHFLHPDDIRWIQRLTAPRVLAAARYQEHRSGVDDVVAGRALETIHDTIATHGPQTRPEISAALDAAGHETGGGRIGLLLMRAELTNLITSGPLRDRTHTYELLDRRAPAGRQLDGDEALAELTRRYFTSHGPATEKDLAWWASLTRAQVRRGIAHAEQQLEAVVVDGVRYWQGAGTREKPAPDHHGVLLLPVYDEYAVAYPDSRHLVFDDPGARWSRTPQSQPLLLDGRAVGWWRHSLAAPTLELTSVVTLRPRQRRAAETVAGEFLHFTCASADVRWSSPTQGS